MLRFALPVLTSPKTPTYGRILPYVRWPLVGTRNVHLPHSRRGSHAFRTVLGPSDGHLSRVGLKLCTPKAYASLFAESACVHLNFLSYSLGCSFDDFPRRTSGATKASMPHNPLHYVVNCSWSAVRFPINSLSEKPQLGRFQPQRGCYLLSPPLSRPSLLLPSWQLRVPGVLSAHEIRQLSSHQHPESD
jgi:hypothetical protein